MVSPSNLAFVLEAVKDVAEGSSEVQKVVRKAGYLLFNLIILHPFLDGNKRTAFEVAKNFLTLNGWKLNPSEDDAFDSLLSAAKGSSDLLSTEKWIARNLSRGGIKP